LNQNGITMSGYEILVNGARQTHRLGFNDDSERLKTTLLLGGKRLPQLNNGQVVFGCRLPPKAVLPLLPPQPPLLLKRAYIPRVSQHTQALLVCHLLDHLTSACPWIEEQVTVQLLPPRSTIPMDERLSQPLEPARSERRRSTKHHRDHPAPHRDRKPSSNSGWSMAGQQHGKNGGSAYNKSTSVSSKRN
jgi:hypothetical protein